MDYTIDKKITDAVFGYGLVDGVYSNEEIQGSAGTTQRPATLSGSPDGVLQIFFRSGTVLEVYATMDGEVKIERVKSLEKDE